MLRHHFISALRHLRKNETYSALNIFGLSVGLACFAMIGLWVKTELSFDKFHEKSDRTYRVVSRYTNETTVIDQAITSPPLAAALARDIPEIEHSTRIDPCDNVVAVGDKRFLEEGIITDQSFFDVFDFKLLSGDRTSLLSEPYSVVISESLARKYFGDVDPIGKTMLIYRFDPTGLGADFKVTGVIEDRPGNTHIPYNFILSFNTWEIFNPTILGPGTWFNTIVYTYFTVHPGSDPAAVQSKLPAMIEKYMGKKRDGQYGHDFFIQPLTDIHLYSNLAYEMSVNSSMSRVAIFSTIGLLTLLLACINYINLATAYATERMKEVGIHKVMGAYKNQLITQHLTESWLIAMFSLVIAIGWMELSRPLFESITGTTFSGFNNLQTLGSLVVIASLVGLIAGFYPAVILSSLKPVSILKGQHSGISNTWLRKILVIVQFSITIILVIGIIGVQLQMQFINDKDIGFDKENLVVFGVHGSSEITNGYKPFADELKTYPSIAGVTRSNTSLGTLGNETAVGEDVNGAMSRTTVYRMRVDFEYLDVYNMKLLAGRNFQVDNGADSSRSFIVNEATTKAFGYDNPADAIGKRFQYANRDGQIIGVVKDFNYHSLQRGIEPFCAFLLSGGFSRITVKINGDPKAGINDISRIWRKHFPTSVIQYSFVEDTFANEYRAESRFSDIFVVFSIISLLIACLGLFALVSFTVKKRSKEIGIRKVLGATVSNILSMLSREFLILIILSAFVAIPIGYYFLQEWLSGFAYHIPLNAMMFVGAGVLVLVVASATVSLRTFSAASSNPVDSLRSE